MIGSRFDVETREIENRLEERDSSKGDVDAEVVARVDLVLDRLDSSDVSREHDDLLPDGVPHWAIGSVPPQHWGDYGACYKYRLTRDDRARALSPSESIETFSEG